MFKTNLSGHNKYGGFCPGMYPVATGLFRCTLVETAKDIILQTQEEQKSFYIFK